MTCPYSTCIAVDTEQHPMEKRKQLACARIGWPPCGSFGYRNGQNDLAVRLSAFGYRRDAGQLDFLQILGQIV